MSSPQIVKSAARVLEIFEYLSEHREGATISEIASALGYPQSSTSALMRSLFKLGYLLYQPETRTYSPTIRITMLGSRTVQTIDPSTDIIELMDNLHAETKYTVLLGVRNELYVQYASVIRGINPSIYVRIGAQRPICLSGLGRVLLSMMADDDVSKIARHWNATTPDAGSRVDVGGLIDEMGRCRKNGYLRSDGIAQSGRAVIAMPLRLKVPHPEMSVAVGGPKDLIARDAEAIVCSMRRWAGDFHAKNA